MVRVLTPMAALLVVLGVALYLSPLRPAKSHSYYLYVCTGCGLQRSVKESHFGLVTYSRRTSFHSTPVSNGIGTNGCGHAWLLYDRGRTGGGKAGTGPKGGKRKLVNIHVLLDREVAASELARMDNPREKWRLLVTALETNRALDDSLLRWSQELPYRSFQSWWQQSPLAKPPGH